MDCEAQDAENAAGSITESSWAMVQGTPSRADRATTADAEQQATGTLQLLRHDAQLPVPWSVPGAGQAAVVQVAESALANTSTDMGMLSPASVTVSTGTAENPS